MSCDAEGDLDEEELRGGLGDVFGERRVACLRTLERLATGCRGEFATIWDEDAKMVPSLEGNRRTATLYRMEKKRVLDLAIEALHKEAELAKKGGGLPFAVTGLRG
uniref:Uncharacterized protein n=1 Tax=Zooxanthella nutricula TaxID=1333877 RepID=A0A7S2VQL1_9DINO